MIIYDIFELTKKIKRIAELQIKDHSKESIEKLSSSLKERQLLINQLTGNYTEEEKVLGKKIVKLNEEIDILLKTTRGLMVGDMQRFRRQKKSLNSYRGGYQTPGITSAFMDKRE
ncbi:flagellar protein FliT [Sporolactobacillus vineae]|uniref:flagellar protein FliT n=1 Tax=Sporolactobacillus vineae TaxID=444463 RepID=UPI000288AA53|nr:flagellar protein FliT [Sporolactobacillus vineae]